MEPLDRPIVIIGSGGIVKDAHLPAYAKAGFRVQGICDVDLAKAQTLASSFGIERVYTGVEEAARTAPPNAVFDIAVPASAVAGVLEHIPDGRGILIQKPMGETMEQARTIRALCRSKGLIAAVNFQLRFSPAVAAARRLIEAGRIGDLVDIEVRVNVHTPWQLWTFLEQSPRVEILYHSVHYIDLIRSFCGDPASVYAKTLKHPHAPKLAATRTSMILDYGEAVRANVSVNHFHSFGPKHQESFIKWEGTRGAIKTKLGVLLDYPTGQPDEFEYTETEDGKEGEWKRLELGGSWFPDAFARSIASLMGYLDGASSTLPASVEDAYRTMAVVESAYESSARGGTVVHYD
jgi:predicted dehydrogenase